MKPGCSDQENTPVSNATSWGALSSTVPAPTTTPCPLPTLTLTGTYRPLADSLFRLFIVLVFCLLPWNVRARRGPLPVLTAVAQCLECGM